MMKKAYLPSERDALNFLMNNFFERHHIGLGELFSRFGFPRLLVSDKEPQFVAQEMVTFLQVTGVQHIRAAPYHLSTNVFAEQFVQPMKHALKSSQGAEVRFTSACTVSCCHTGTRDHGDISCRHAT